MALVARQVGQDVDHGARGVVRLRLDQGLDQVRADGEGAGVEHALSLGVVPHRGQA